jgi:quercetin dioxygenase-like cupin family protein
MSKQTDATELEKATPYIVVEILEYVPNSVLTKTILRKTTGNVTVSSLDAGEELMEKMLPFDLFVQIIDGTAEVIINKKEYKLQLGEGIIVPAHSSHCFNANEQFKMISTIIKSGYED